MTILEVKIFKYNGGNYSIHKKYKVVAHNQDEVDDLWLDIKRINSTEDYVARCEDITQAYNTCDEFNSIANKICEDNLKC